MKLTRFLPALLALTFALLAASAHAASEPTYSLREGNIVVSTDDGREEISVACKQTFTLSLYERHLYIACGSEGAAVYSLTNPTRPVLAGTLPPQNGECGDVSEGLCTATPARPEVTYVPVASAPVTYSAAVMPAVAFVPAPSFVGRRDVSRPERALADGRRASGIATLAVGGAALVGGATMLVAQLFVDVGSVRCDWGVQGFWNGGCTKGVGPPATNAYAGLGLMAVGVATGLVGASFLIAGRHDTRRPQVTATVSPTGGSLRVGF